MSISHAAPNKKCRVQPCFVTPPQLGPFVTLFLPLLELTPFIVCATYIFSTVLFKTLTPKPKPQYTQCHIVISDGRM